MVSLSARCVKKLLVPWLGLKTFVVGCGKRLKSFCDIGFTRFAGIRLPGNASPVYGLKIVGKSEKSPLRDPAVGTVELAGNGRLLRCPRKSKKKKVRFLMSGP